MDGCIMLPQPVGMLKLLLNLFHTIDIQEQEGKVYFCHFIKYTFNIGMHPDTRELLYL